MNPQIFRQYDIRGIVDKDLVPEIAVQIGRGFGSWVREKGGSRVVLGRDGRLSGPALRDGLVEGVLTSGIDVVDVGMVPTPVLYFALYHFNTDGAIQITGSHNPPEFNGFKMLIGKETLYGEAIQELRRRIEARAYTQGNGTLVKQDVIPAYIDQIVGDVMLKRPVEVALDSGNGVGGIVAPELFRKLGCDPVELFSEVDGRFPNHHPDPTVEKNLVKLRKSVLSKNLECGIAFDGDADRIGVIDDRGDVLWGDRLLALYSRYVLKKHPGTTIIGEVKCSKALYEDIEKHGGKPIMWKTGHSLLKAKLHETNAKLAGEMSGHMFFNDRYFGFDDAIYAAARLAEILASTRKPLSALLSDLPLYPVTPEMRVDCPEEIKFEVVAKVTEHFKSKYDVIDIDGVRINFEHGWGLVRASNTQPVLVLRFEADTKEQLRKYRKEIEGVVAEVRATLE